MPRVGPGHNLTPRGAWSASTAYHVDDLYTQGGSTYRVKTQYTSGTSFGTTDTTNTEVWAAAGATGATGTAGTTGATGATGASGTGGAAGAGGAVFDQPGVLAVATGTNRWYNDTGRTLALHKARASVGTAPTGTVTVDVKKNGTSIFVTPGITVAVGANSQSKTPDAGGTVNLIQQSSSGTFGAGVSATSVLVAVVGREGLDFSGQVNSVSGCGATWTRVVTSGAGEAWATAAIFVGLNPTSGATGPVTAAVSTGTAFVHVYELAAARVEVPTHAGSTTSGGVNVSALAGPALTGTAGGDLLIVGGRSHAANETALSSSGATWTDDDAGTQNPAAHLTAPDGTTAETATFTFTGTTNRVALAGVVIRAAPATINDGDYLTYDVTAADGTAADLVVQVSMA